MRILTDVRDFHSNPKEPLVLGLGNFDGVHLGHQTLLKRVLESARYKKGVASVFTFFEHPQRVLHPDSKPPLLTSLEHKLFLLEELGMDLCFLNSFTQEFSRLEPADFVEKILVNQLSVGEVCLGYNAHFGRDRKGDASLMQTLANRFGFQFEEMKPVKVAGDFVSSSRIRKLIESGDLKQAAACLGRSFSIFGKVVKGEGRGATLGVPTANLEVLSEILPPQGVYAVLLRVMAESKESRVGQPGPWLQGVLNYGCRPTFKSDAKQPIAEVFILNFQQDLYKKTLEVIFLHRLRSEIAFESAEALKNQIEKDIKDARSYFDTLPKKTFTKAAIQSILPPNQIT